MVAINGSIMTTPFSAQGSQDGYAVPKMTALAASGINPIPRYKLACYDSTGTRQFWVDTGVSLTNAPVLGGGATYVTNTLVVEGQF